MLKSKTFHENFYEYQMQKKIKFSRVYQNGVITHKAKGHVV